MKERKWVDIDDNKRQEVKFTPLNESGKKNAVNDNRNYAFMLKTMLESFIHLRKKERQTIKESNSTDILKKASDIDAKDSRMGHKFFTGTEERSAGEWREFERHVEIITQFMNIKQTEMKSMLEAMKKSFIALSELTSGQKGEDPTKALDNGFDELENLDRIFQDAGISGLEPAIRASRFLDLLSPYFKQKDKDNGGKVKELPIQRQGDKSFEYDIATFIKMLKTRKNRKLADKLASNRSYNLKNILVGMLGKNKNIEMVLDIFRKIVNQGGYSKNNSSVGKGEIALAMFFGDCRLPDSRGDIEISPQNGTSQAVEVKGESAGITDRNTIQKDVLSMSYAEAMNKTSGHENDMKNLINKLEKEASHAWKLISGNSATSKNADDIYDAFKNIIEAYSSENDSVDDNTTEDNTTKDIISEGKSKKAKEEHNWTWKEGFKFFILFGILAKTYFQKFDSMIILNTDDNLNMSVDESNLFNKKMVKISYPKNGNWYERGLKMLRDLDKILTVKYENRSYQGTFKVYFK